MSRLLEHVRSEHLRRQGKKKPEARRNDAVKERYGMENPVRMISERPRGEKTDPACLPTWSFRAIPVGFAGRLRLRRFAGLRPRSRPQYHCERSLRP